MITDTAVEYNSQGQPSEAWLRRLYQEERVPVAEIARLTGHHNQYIYWLMDKYGIARHTFQPPIDAETLQRLYVTEDMTALAIAEQYGMTDDKVYYWLRYYHIPVKAPRLHRATHPTREWLIQRHRVEKVSWVDIMRETGYSRVTFHRLLHDLGIERKQYVPVRAVISRDDLQQWHVVDGMTAEKIAAHVGCSATAVQRLIKRYRLDPGRPLVNEPIAPPVSKEELERLYWTEHQPLRVIATAHGVSIPTVRGWFRKYGLAARTGKRQTGPKAQPTQRVARIDRRYPNEFDAAERLRIHTRDNWHCQMPGCGCAERWRLEAHHIIPIADGGTNALDNGISLCKSCHIRIFGKEREYVALFQETLKKL